MGDWISDLLIFSAGITGGILISLIASCLRAHREQHTELVAARTRILADMKDHHDQEILHAAFRTAEDIKDELHKSALTLQKALLATVDPPPVTPEEPRDRATRSPRPAASH